MLPLALSMAGSIPYQQVLSGSRSKSLHMELKRNAFKLLRVHGKKGRLLSVIKTSCDLLPPGVRELFELMLVLGSSTVATKGMLANLWRKVRASGASMRFTEWYVRDFASRLTRPLPRRLQ